MSTFDNNVFDPGALDAIDPTLSVFKVAVPIENRHIPAGGSVPITIYIYNESSSPGRKIPANPLSNPQIRIYKPDGTVHLAYTDMVYLSTGVYTYRHQAGSDPVGPYAAEFKAVNGITTCLTKPMVIFEVV